MTTAPETDDVRGAARSSGLLAGLAVLLGVTGAEAPEEVLAGTRALRGPGGYGVVLSRGPAAGTSEAVLIIGNDVRVVRCAGLEPDPAVLRPEFDDVLLALRLGFGEHLRDHATERLRTRPSGDGVLLSSPLVRSQLAEIAGRQAEAAGRLGGAGRTDTAARRPGNRAAVHRLHTLLTTIDRSTLRLLGASGYVAGSPGADAHLSELLPFVLTGPEEARRPTVTLAEVGV